MSIEKSPYEIALERIEAAARAKSTSLALPKLGLDVLPPEIKKLTNLSTLYLHNNKLSYLPTEFWNLTNLTKLSLSNNQFGVISPEINRLSKLSALWLNNNKLKTLPQEIGELKYLRSLWANDNKISSLPKSIKNLNNLSQLWLNDNEIEVLPSEIGELANLKELWLSSNKLYELPPEIGRLKNLRNLLLPRNKLKVVPQDIKELINLEMLILGDLFGGNDLEFIPKEIGFLTKLSKLDISRNHLQSLPSEIQNLQNLLELRLSNNLFLDFPPEIYKLSRLSVLWLSGNQIKSTPKEISKLVNLSVLWLSDNQINFVHPSIGELKNLSELYLHGNNIAELPVEVGNLKNLSVLSVYKNKLKSITPSIKNLKNIKRLDLRKNPRLAIPPEILEIRHDPKFILDSYFSARQSLNEAKLLFVGQGSVGKTSLVRRFLENKFDLSQPKTDGIVISYGKIPSKNKSQLGSVNLNIWDFGGQEIMHATHQFFLTKRSLYLLALDSRLTQEENRVEYWLKIIQSFSDESPVLIVGNKTDQHPLDIDRAGLQKKYPNIVGILETSAATGAGIEALKSAIAEQVNNLPHVRDLLPETWFTVKTKLEGLGRESNFITHDKYLELCAENEVSDETSQRTLIGFLHDLGVVLHFQDDPRLEALGILNPQWVTNGVYKILNSHTLFQNKGVLTTSMLDEILNLPEYPRGKRLFIVDMMKKFELCYDIEPDKTFLVPDLLPKDEPATDGRENALAFQYHYAVLPSSVITRFIVRMNEYAQEKVWRSGVVLKDGGNIALVKADIEDRKIFIWVSGDEHKRHDFLSKIRGQFDAIHKTITRLDAKEMVPVPGHPEAEPVDYDLLLQMDHNNVEVYPVLSNGKMIVVNVKAMLNGVARELDRQRNNVTNFYIGGDVKDSTIIAGDENEINKE